jgi:hypothetical protein
VGFGLQEIAANFGNGLIIAYLIEREGVDPARITECRSTFDPTDQGNPRAEVVF